MQHSQQPQMSVKHWRRTLPLPLHCGYEIESRIDSQIFHRQNPICSFPEMNKGQFEATKMAHHMLNSVFVGFIQEILWGLYQGNGNYIYGHNSK
jgi:hypothetical protein